MKNQRKAYFFAAITVMLWATVATAFKLGLQYLPVVPLITVASVTSCFVFLLFIVFKKQTYQLKLGGWKAIGRSALIGGLNPVLYYIVLFKAYSLLPAQVAQPLNMVWPITLVLLSVPILKQKITKLHIVAILVSFVGVFFISSQGEIDSLQNTNLFGVILALSSSVVWSLFWILNVRDQRAELIKLFWNLLFGSIYLLIIFFGFVDYQLSWGMGMWIGIYIGFFEMGFAYISWMIALQYSENNAKTGNLVFITPFLSLIFIHWVLKEEIFYTTFIGLVFIIGGILIQQIKRKTVSEN